ncbi:transglutaminase N-terminal domain-containing protein [Chloroflexota bacterium]
MRFEISHTIRYIYTASVFMEPMTVRLRPRCNAMQHLERFELEVEPHPTGSSDNLDLYSNNTNTLWFHGLHDHLTVHASSVVNIANIDPFDFMIIEEGTVRLPAVYPGHHSKTVDIYSRQRYQSSLLDDFVRPILTRSNSESMPFLLNLTTEIYEQFTNDARDTGEPLHPEDTLARRSGACRDLALLFMECCRSVGLAARFVSGYGYCENVISLEKSYMHAWAEVYLPGGGWKGFDPSIGLAVSDDHVAVAVAADPEDASPTRGTFRGTGVQSKIEYDVSIKCQT